MGGQESVRGGEECGHRCHIAAGHNVALDRKARRRLRDLPATLDSPTLGPQRVRYTVNSGIASRARAHARSAGANLKRSQDMVGLFVEIGPR